jgi:hypothetical protein
MFPCGNSPYVFRRFQTSAPSGLSWRLWRNPARFGISERCGRISPFWPVFRPRIALPLSLCPKTVDVSNPSAARENRGIACFLKGGLENGTAEEDSNVLEPSLALRSQSKAPIQCSREPCAATGPALRASE